MRDHADVHPTIADPDAALTNPSSGGGARIAPGTGDRMSTAFTNFAEYPVDPAGAVVYEHGWQSWSPTGVHRVPATSPRPGRERWQTMAYRPETPAIATLSTFMFLYAWNSFIWPFIVISAGNLDNHVLTVSLQQLGGRAADSPNLILAGVMIAISVPVTVFVLAQRYFVENVATSGIK